MCIVGRGATTMTDLNPDNKPDKPLRLPKPKPFHITEPKKERGLWCFWLTADDDILKYVRHLHCILHPMSSGSFFTRRMNGRVMFAINPRYDHDNAWQWIVDMLQTETSSIELDDSWESAIDDALPNKPDDK